MCKHVSIVCSANTYALLLIVDKDSFVLDDICKMLKSINLFIGIVHSCVNVNCLCSTAVGFTVLCYLVSESMACVLLGERLVD